MDALFIERHALLELLRLGALEHAKGGWLLPNAEGVLAHLASSHEKGAVRWLATGSERPPEKLNEGLCIVVASTEKGRFEAFAWRHTPQGWRRVPLEMVEAAQPAH